MKKFSDRMREAMTIRGTKQVDLVRETGIDKGTISHYLKGNYEPKGSNLEKIARALDVNEAWLAGYDVPRQNYDILYREENGGRAIGDDEVIDPDVYNFLEVLELKLSHITDSAKRKKALKALRSTLDLIEE